MKSYEANGLACGFPLSHEVPFSFLAWFLDESYTPSWIWR